MKICGLQKTTLLDYPGHVAATIFIGGCNFRCPFCHNGSLLSNDAEEIISQDELFSFLKRRRSILEGVCITGGEPTLSKGLEALMVRIKGMGYKIKLDTNGCRPDIIKKLSFAGLLDYIAMDIKGGRRHYPQIAGVLGLPMKQIEESVSFLMESGIPYEFRTTVVKELHDESDFKDIGFWLSGCSRYFLQSYVDSQEVLCSGFHACTKKDLLAFAEIVRPYIPDVSLRGVAY